MSIDQDHYQLRLTPAQYDEYNYWTGYLLRATGYSDFRALGDFDSIRRAIQHDEVYYAVLNFVWSLVEAPHREERMIHRVFFPRGLKRRFEFLMDPSELDVLTALPDPVTLYRGVTDQPHPGWSWTLSRPQAVWFARRRQFKDTPAYVLTAQVERRHIIAYDDGRNEQEIIVDPRWVRFEATRLSDQPDDAERQEQADLLQARRRKEAELWQELRSGQLKRSKSAAAT